MTLGKYRVWLNRLQGYLSMFNFAMIGFLFLRDPPFGINWYYFVIIGIFIIPLILFIDIKYIMPQMQEYTFNKNPQLTRLRKDVKEIKEIIKNG